MWDILYAVDASSSMADSRRPKSGQSYVKIEAVKNALAGLLNGSIFPTGCRLGVITFHAATRAMGILVDGSQVMVEQIIPLTSVGELMPEDSFLRRLSAIKLGGATPSGIAILKGLDLLYAGDEESKSRIKKMVLVTDERSNAGPKPQEVVNEKVARRVIIDIVAIGGRVNRGVLEPLASKTGGRFTEVDEERELEEALKPLIRVAVPAPDAALVEKAKDLARQITNANPSSLEYKKILENVRQERAKLNKRLMELLVMKEKTKREVDRLVAQVTESQGQPKLSMKEYSEKVWPSASELAGLETLEAELRNSVIALAT
jgi:Mg-chelatase subunit ChlD